MDKTKLSADYPWLKEPLIACAPLRGIALGKLAVETSKAGGIGFIGSGADQSNLATLLEEAYTLCGDAGLPTSPLGVGVGFLNWGADKAVAIEQLGKYPPVAVWFFAPEVLSDLEAWVTDTREATKGLSKIWIQVGTVEEAVQLTKTCGPDVLVVQGADAGGHGLMKSASIMVLVPEVIDELRSMKEQGVISSLPSVIAAGGIIDGRGVAAALVLGAEGVAMGTRYLAATESNISKGYRDEVLRADDGGQSTVRGDIYDKLRRMGTWPERYGGRGLINQSYHDTMAGRDWKEIDDLYQEDMKKGDSGWGPQGRLTTYAGTGVGLVRKEQSAKEITEEVRQHAISILSSSNPRRT